MKHSSIHIFTYQSTHYITSPDIFEQTQNRQLGKIIRSPNQKCHRHIVIHIHHTLTEYFSEYGRWLNVNVANNPATVENVKSIYSVTINLFCWSYIDSAIHIREPRKWDIHHIRPFVFQFCRKRNFRVFDTTMSRCSVFCVLCWFQRYDTGGVCARLNVANNISYAFTNINP